MPISSPITRKWLVKTPILNTDSRSVRQPKPFATWPATMAAWVMVSASRYTAKCGLAGFIQVPSPQVQPWERRT